MEWFWDSRRGGGSLQWQALEIAVCIPKKWGDLENGRDFEKERVCVGSHKVLKFEARSKFARRVCSSSSQSSKRKGKKQECFGLVWFGLV